MHCYSSGSQIGVCEGISNVCKAFLPAYGPYFYAISRLCKKARNEDCIAIYFVQIVCLIHNCGQDFYAILQKVVQH